MFFTSKLANNTEVIAFLSSGVSFNRFLRPYIIGATLVCGLALMLSAIFVPRAASGFNEFHSNDISKAGREQKLPMFLDKLMTMIMFM